MKIIGRTDGGFIFEASRDELERLGNILRGQWIYEIGATVPIFVAPEEEEDKG